MQAEIVSQQGLTRAQQAQSGKAFYQTVCKHVFMAKYLIDSSLILKKIEHESWSMKCPLHFLFKPCHDSCNMEGDIRI